MDIRSTLEPSDILTRSAAWALAVGAVAAPFAAAQADPIVTNVNQDFPASISFDGVTAFTISGTTITGVGSNEIEIYGSGYGPGTANKLQAGATISAGSFGGTGAGTANLGFQGAKTNYFIGLVIDAGNGVDYYGYADVGGPGGNPDELIDYAFESDPNTAITVVDPNSIPEPGSLALLAAGAAAALAIRRRTGKSAAFA
jgi:hypothetical protein